MTQIAFIHADESKITISFKQALNIASWLLLDEMKFQSFQEFSNTLALEGVNITPSVLAKIKDKSLSPDNFNDLKELLIFFGYQNVSAKMEVLFTFNSAI